MAEEWWNLKQVARELGVHYMTAYRYVRQGRLPARWVDNGWLVLRSDVAAFRQGVAVNVSTVAPADGETGVDWAGRLAPLLVQGDEPAAWSILETALASGIDPRDCYLTVVGGAMARLGAEWDHDDRAANVDERLATATALRLVHRLGARFARPGRRKGSVVLGAPVGERHTLPVALAADLVRLEGYTVLELGGDVDAETFVVAAQRADRLVAVGISLTTAEALDAAIEIRRRLADDLPDVPVIVGGQAVANPDVASMLGSSGWASNGAELASLLDRVSSTRRSPNRVS